MNWGEGEVQVSQQAAFDKHLEEANCLGSLAS